MAYSAKTWQLLKNLYSSGAYSSIPELLENCTKSGIKCPSESAVKKRAALENWDKHELAAEIKRSIREETVSLFAEFGMPHREVVRRVADGCRAGEELSSMVLDAISAIRMSSYF